MAAPEGNKFAEGNEGGRPTKFKDEYVEQAYKLCLLGATDKELADFFEISESTLNEWKLVHNEFSESLKKGKGYADAEVANKLFKRANGYSYDEISYEKIDIDTGTVSIKGEDGESKDDIKVDAYKKRVVTKEVVPDVTAQIFWLKNRQKEKWRDKTEVGHSGSLGITLIEDEPDGTDEPITD